MASMPTRVLWTWPVLWLLGACASGPAPQPEQGPGPPPPGAESGTPPNAVALEHRRSHPDLEVHMQANFLVAADARDAVIDGDLVRAIEAFKWIAEQSFDGLLPDEWKPFSARLQEAALAGTLAPTLQDAAHRVAAVAQRCGDCHRNFAVGEDRGVEEEQGFAPVGPEHVDTRMARHQWAADELWHGLIIPSDKTWQGGARILIDAPLQPPLLRDGSADPQLAAEIADLRALGQRALEAQDVGSRVEIYGAMLGRCAGCHTRRQRR